MNTRACQVVCFCVFFVFALLGCFHCPSLFNWCVWCSGFVIFYSLIAFRILLGFSGAFFLSSGLLDFCFIRSLLFFAKKNVFHQEKKKASACLSSLCIMLSLQRCLRHLPRSSLASFSRFSSSSTLMKTPLYDGSLSLFSNPFFSLLDSPSPEHVKLKGNMVDFAGWALPLKYENTHIGFYLLFLFLLFSSFFLIILFP